MPSHDDIDIDGCTGFLDSFLESRWYQCCVQHDIDYWIQDIPRALADEHMRTCIMQTGVAGAFFGGIMWFGVRIFGGKYYKRGKRGNVKDNPRFDPRHRPK